MGIGSLTRCALAAFPPPYTVAMPALHRYPVAPPVLPAHCCSVRQTLPCGSAAAVSVSSDSQRVASCSRDGSVRVWDPESSQCVNVFTEHGADVHSAEGRGVQEDVNCVQVCCRCMRSLFLSSIPSCLASHLDMPKHMTEL